ncbi:hypothetical protein [Methylocystis parvus]|uniref:hypothetical protein n=1 Tax=Methylocystis parvus TaxID=134 RepID=UPI003C738FF0
MSSSLLKGWDIWLEAGGRFRKLTVAVNDLDEAQNLALARAPDAKIAYVTELPHEIMSHLQARAGQIAEWVSVDPKSPIEPPNVRK